MTIPRLFVANDIEADAEMALAPAQAHYLMHVLRLSEGAEILAFDGKNGEWRAEIVKARKAACCIKMLQKVREQTAAQDVHYAFAPLKQARLDYMVQKATEMGASVLRPVITAHTVVPRLNLEKMHANAIEAAEQCGILTVPSIEPPVKLEALLKACQKSRVIVFCDERAAIAPPLEALAKLQGAQDYGAHRPRRRIFGKRTRAAAFKGVCLPHIARAADHAGGHGSGGGPGPRQRGFRRLALIASL